jgi:hypothetical protein
MNGMLNHSFVRTLPLCVVALAAAGAARADFTLSFSDADFDLTPIYNEVDSFEFEIVMSGSLSPGTVYSEDDVVSVDYSVQGTLKQPTPSGFPAFFLVRSMDGDEFRAQGSSMFFEIAAGADLCDGLQFDELTGSDPVFGSRFLLNAREVGTGRYHPPIMRLVDSGAGSFQNSNNFGGVNPATGMVVDVDFGEEYIAGLGFTPAGLTLAGPVKCVGDVDCSGAIDFNDLLSVLAAWGPCGGCPQDFDASGTVDFTDLLTVLAAWGPCA